ncbi:hypothetical protein J1N35_040380 [Gossypium stocksii]|uniref:DUF1421 domain-containing protein n=1 Tax=Gossypium stocksii TaxID=47602 RepID=A0A9D3ZIA5_9ROSI|nr:hypothetical protein J1N35_040380 [Gossypium stocksii]
MNTSQFMDKQIMDLTLSSSSPPHNSHKDFIDLMSHPQNEDNHNQLSGFSASSNGASKVEMLSDYDFQPIRPVSTRLDAAGVFSNPRSWSSIDSKAKNYGSLDSLEPAKGILDKDQSAFDTSILAEIDGTMKKHTDNLMHMMEKVSDRLTQLESRTRHLENSLDDLKVSVGNNHGSTDRKMKQLENILTEVQTGVHDLKEKQEIMEAQLQLAKLQVSKVDQPSEPQNTVRTESVQQVASAPFQSHQQLPLAASFPQSLPSISPPALPQPSLPPPVQHANQFPQSHVPSVPQQDPYYPSPGQTQETLSQQFPMPPTQQPQLPPATPPHQPYQPAPPPQYSQPPQPLQLQPSVGHHSDEAPYPPSQIYPPNLRQPPSQPPSGGPPSSQQYYGAPPQLREPSPSSRPGPGFSTGYIPQSGPSEPYAYGGSPSQYGSGNPMKMQQLPSSPMGQNSGSGYPQLPTAKILPHALPTASGVSGGSSPSGPGNRVPIDDVIDKVTTMGFPRDHVRATVRKLTENGQSVDLNVVLDKLMNDSDVQPPRGWFGR